MSRPDDIGKSEKSKLLRIYRLFDEWAGEFSFACGEGCATCCTRSVTMTSLEGELIREYLADKPELLALLHDQDEDVQSPALTTNGFARACIRGEEIEDGPSWDLRPCVFLKNDRCMIYPVRSFMCRSFGSRARCREGAVAEIPQLYLTLTTVIMQSIEHLDRGNPWGNMLPILLPPDATGPGADQLEKRLPKSEPIPGFMIPPEEADRLSDKITILMSLLKDLNP